MLRKLLFLSLFIIFVLRIAPKASADSKQFSIATDIVYSIADDGTTTVTQNIHLKNKTQYIFTPTYTFSTGVRDIENVKATNNSGPLPIEIQANKNNEKLVQITFKNRITGTDKENDFSISYSTHDIAHRLGQIWQISIPGISDPSLYESYSVTVRIPESFGNASILKPQPFAHLTSSQAEEGKNEIIYSKSDIGRAGIFLEFGSVQYYTMTLSYHIENPNFFPINSEIALPPETNYQDVAVQKLDPAPENVIQDVNGNWIALYKLAPHERQDITGLFIAKVYASPSKEPLSSHDRDAYLSDQQYWDVNNGEIRDLAASLQTPEKIYEYVKSKLTYNFSKVNGDNRRLGAYGVLHDSNYAVCLEFTDLFIALARAAGIPAREVEGYAYTQNQTLKPLSAARDILHTWPEYYDAKQEKWIAVDPTWGNTTNGSDYFNSMDFEHIAFVINGDNSTYPIPAGGYKIDSKSKDISVNFAAPSDYVVSPHGEMIDDLPQFVLSGLGITGQVLIKNTGTTPLSGFQFVVDSALIPHEKTYTASKVPPYGTLPVPIHFDGTRFLTNAPYKVTMHSGSSILTHTITVGFIPEKSWIIIGGVLLIGGAVIFIITTKARSLFVPRRRR